MCSGSVLRACASSRCVPWFGLWTGRRRYIGSPLGSSEAFGVMIVPLPTTGDFTVIGEEREVGVNLGSHGSRWETLSWR